MPDPTCRLCAAPLQHVLVDLGMTPLCESYLDAERVDQPEPLYPLRPFVCEHCMLVQLDAVVPPETIFSDYAYQSSYSDSWVRHAERYAEMAIARWGLDDRHLVVEVASNDGYLLQHFVRRGIAVLGIDPAANLAPLAAARGVPTLTRFFDRAVARELVDSGRRADLVVANNVLAHVPDLHGFIAAIAELLAPDGIATLEFPHLLQLLVQHQFDTIYHEHFSYFSLRTARQAFADHGLRCFDVEELPTHGGSLRLYVCADTAEPATQPSIAQLLERERRAGLERIESYAAFADRVRDTKDSLLAFLHEARRRGRTVVGYGAPGKGNTLLNYCGVRSDLLGYTVDRNPHKQGRLLPGSRIPIHAPEHIAETRPDYVLILPWNLQEEITAQMAGIRAWGGRFAVPIPTLRVLP